MHIGITGTRNGLTEEQFERLKIFFEYNQNITHLHAGDCLGVDVQVLQVCRELRPDIKCIGHPPFNNKLRGFMRYDEQRKPKTYLERNRNIVDECHRLWAFPKGENEVLRSGTWATIRYARVQNKFMVIVFPDGSCN